MAELTIRLRCDPATGKKDIVVSLRSDADALPQEHEQQHRALVEKLIAGGLLKAGELGQVVVEREEREGEAVPPVSAPPQAERGAEKAFSGGSSDPRVYDPPLNGCAQRITMILTFPDLDTLRLALTSGALPAGVALAPAVAGFEDDGRLWIECADELPKKALAELRRLGAAVVKGRGTAAPVQVSCWLQLFPLFRSAELLANPRQTPVIFELADRDALAPLVTEMLRLGNDRQGYRWLEDPRGTSPGRALLRVAGPPYYSLLRAIDRDGQKSAPVAFFEQAAGVWVQLGYRHPLADHLKPPAGKLLFLRPPRRWTALADAPFRDIYDVLEFSLPAPKTSWREGELGRRLTVPLAARARRKRQARPNCGSLRDQPVEQLDELVREADDALLNRLSFAVAENDTARVVVLRVRPSKQAPPALALRAVEFCHFQKMPNLFLPVGTRLHPPLRRDAARRHLAEDADAGDLALPWTRWSVHAGEPSGDRVPAPVGLGRLCPGPRPPGAASVGGVGPVRFRGLRLRRRESATGSHAAGAGNARSK